MQGMTRNPLADSGLLGLNSGAAFMLAVCFAFFPGLPYMYLILWSFVGAGLGVAIVYGIGSLSKGGLTPMRLVLAGVLLVRYLGRSEKELLFIFVSDKTSHFGMRVGFRAQNGAIYKSYLHGYLLR